MNLRTASVSGQRGMMLLEVMIAVVLFAIGVLGIVKMQAVSTANSINSEDRATAALLANDLISELWANGTATAPSDYGTWQTRVTNTLRDGVGTLSTAGGTPVVATITITWTRQLGRNIDIGNSAASDPEKTATYTTQVIVAQN